MTPQVVSHPASWYAKKINEGIIFHKDPRELVATAFSELMREAREAAEGLPPSGKADPHEIVKIYERVASKWAMMVMLTNQVKLHTGGFKILLKDRYSELYNGLVEAGMKPAPEEFPKKEEKDA
jgi:hypothetical protein